MVSFRDIPSNANTPCDFCEALTAADVLDALHVRLDRAIGDAGFPPMSGQIVDATLVAAPHQISTPRI